MSHPVSLHARWGVKLNDAILAEDKHKLLYAELAKTHDVEYIAGGATQNSIRVAQWMLQAPGATAYVGCVGNDEFATKMREQCEKDGVKTAYLVDAATPTGVC